MPRREILVCWTLPSRLLGGLRGPSENRESILIIGLDPAFDQVADEEDDPGAYLTTTAPPPASGMDVWRVDTAGIPVEPDPSHASATRQEGYEAQAAGSWAVAYAPIPPERLTLLHDGRSAC